MSDTFEVKLPKLGESIVEATIVKWLKKEGEAVAYDEPLLEVTTDKVNSEIPSPVAGTLLKIVALEDAEVQVGDLLAQIGEQAEVESTKAAPAPAPAPATKKTKEPVAAPSCGKNSSFFSPSVMRLAQREQLSMDILEKIEGSGEGGRVTKKDIEAYLASRTEKAPVAKSLVEPTSSILEERVKMTGMRKAIADNMVRSFYEAPHASLVTEADVTEIMQLIRHEKERFVKTHGAKLTITSFLLQALSKALLQFPLLNASLEQETIVMKRYINIGMAVNVEGGLVVPVIKNCQERNLVSLAKAIGDLAGKARAHKLAPDEVKEGTITLSNFGATKALMGVPIIRYPEVAIIGAGTIQKRVVVRDDDSFAVRQMIYLTLTFDHRIIDGIYGCEFLAAVKHNLESITST